MTGSASVVAPVSLMTTLGPKTLDMHQSIDRIGAASLTQIFQVQCDVADLKWQSRIISWLRE